MAIVIPYVKQTWTDGSGGGTPVSAARLGVLEEGILDVSQAPTVRVYHNTTQSITNSGAAVALAFNSEVIDQAAGASSTMHDTVTNNSRLTAIYAGVYQISANWAWAASASSPGLTAAIRINGTTTICRLVLPSVDVREGTLSTIWNMAVNDYAEVVVTQNSAGAVNISSSGTSSPGFGMVRVG